MAAFNKHKRQSFYAAFAHLKQGKGKCKGKEREIAVVPENFAKYVESVGQMAASITPHLESSIIPF